MDTINIKLNMPNGLKGEDAMHDNPLARASAQLLQNGKPFQKLSECFYGSDESALRWLGVFVHSAGDRILFFPGYSTPPTGLNGFKSTNEICKKPFLFDHATLESNRKSWHITTHQSTDHFGNPPTLDLGESRVLWFGLSLQNEDALRLLMQDTVISACVPAEDSKRRIDVLMEAIQDVKSNIVSLNTEQGKSKGENFLHFSFIVGPRGFPDYIGRTLGEPFNSPFLVNPLPEKLNNIPIRIHRVELSGNIDIQITSCELPGALNVPMAFTSPN